MRDDPNLNDWAVKSANTYQALNYETSGLASFFLLKSHQWLESNFTSKCYFSKVLEVGAGSGVHFNYISHRFDEYYLTDNNEYMLEAAKRLNTNSSKIFFEMQDAACLEYASNTFDRVIASHVLEHLERPHEVLREWFRVLKPGGVLSILLPCDPGLLWRFGRNLGARNKFVSIDVDYDYWMAREHINAITNLVSLIDFYFSNKKEVWYPLRIAYSDLNLFYVCHITK